MRGALFTATLAGLFLAGCSEQAILGAQPARTAAECRAQYDEAMSRGSRAYAPPPTTGAGAAGASLGKGLARGIIEGAYNQCLARVAQSGGDMRGYPDPNNARTRAEAELDRQYYGGALPVTSNGCPRDASVMYGGKRYCVKGAQ